MMDKIFIASAFALALAAFLWRSLPRAGAWDVAAALPQEDVPDMPAELAYTPPELVVGMSYVDPAQGEPGGNWRYSSNVPSARPPLPAQPPSVYL